MSDGDAFTLDVPYGSKETDADGTEWYRMKPEWMYGKFAQRSWAQALKQHQKAKARGKGR